MNFTFQALLLFGLSLPGILFRYSYRRGLGKGPLAIGAPAEEIAFGLLFTVAIHCLVIPILPILSLLVPSLPFIGVPPTKAVDMHHALLLLSGTASPDSIKNFAENFFYISSYFILTSLIGSGAGILLHLWVRSQRWDLTTGFFRFPNPWSYAFSEDAAAVELLKQNNQKVTAKALKSIVSEEKALCIIDALVSDYTEKMIISGIVTDYEFTKSGELDRITLCNATRRKLPIIEADGNPTDENKGRIPITVGSDLFVLPYAKILNLNISFMRSITADSIDSSDS